jgi:hypothetical protein
MAHGSIPTGPSKLYLRLLKGEIEPADYAKQAKKRAHADARKRPVATRAQAQRV